MDSYRKWLTTHSLCVCVFVSVTLSLMITHTHTHTLALSNNNSTHTHTQTHTHTCCCCWWWWCCCTKFTISEEVREEADWRRNGAVPLGRHWPSASQRGGFCPVIPTGDVEQAFPDVALVDHFAVVANILAAESAWYQTRFIITNDLPKLDKWWLLDKTTGSAEQTWN